MKNVMKVACLLVLILGFVSCNKDDSNNNPEEQNAEIAVRLTDSPGDYDAVYVDVQDVMIRYNGSEEEVSIGSINAGVYDLLELTGGVSVLLV
jgi:hypothetical protein